MSKTVDLTIFLFCSNQENQFFWQQQLHDEALSIDFKVFTGESSSIEQLGTAPGLIIVDGYFDTGESQNWNEASLFETLLQQAPEFPIFLFSPRLESIPEINHRLHPGFAGALSHELLRSIKHQIHRIGAQAA